MASISTTMVLGDADTKAVSTESRRAARHPRASLPSGSGGSVGTVLQEPSAPGGPRCGRCTLAAKTRAATAKTCADSTITCWGSRARRTRSPLLKLGRARPCWLKRYPRATQAAAEQLPATRSCSSGWPARAIQTPRRAPKLARPPARTSAGRGRSLSRRVIPADHRTWGNPDGGPLAGVDHRRWGPGAALRPWPEELPVRLGPGAPGSLVGNR